MFAGPGRVIETVWLDNPPVNAVNSAIIETLWNAFENLVDDVRAVVLRGKGERAFSAGADISGFVGGIGRRRAARRHPAGRRPDRGRARAGRRGDPRLLPRRRARDRARVRLPHRDARRAARLPGGEPRPAARRRRHAARAAADRARPRALADDVGRAHPRRDRRARGGSSSSSSTISKRASRSYVEPLDKQSPHAIRQIKQLLRETRDARSDEREVAGVRGVPHLGGRAGGRRRVPREARGQLDRSVKAAVLHEVGGELAIEERPGAAGTVVDVRAAGVNFADVLIRRGLYPQMPELPYVLGNEVAGDLDGRRVRRAAARRGGLCRTRRARSRLGVRPAGERVVRAGAAFLTTYLTAYIPYRSASTPTRCSSMPGRAGSAPPRSSSRSSRARRVRDREHAGEARARARRSAPTRCARYDEIDDLRVDVVIDPVGGDVFTRSLPLLNPLGTIVAIGFAGGLWQDPSVQWLVGRNAAVMGVYLGRLMKLRPGARARVRRGAARAAGDRRDRRRSSARRSRSPKREARSR